MMHRRLLILSMVSAFALSACSSKFKRYTGPRVTRVIVFKGQRKMHLMHKGKALRSYDFALGFAPNGHKVQEGDGRTPEGEYLIDRRNPNSSFHLSIGIDYPRPADIARAEALGVSPGGEIFIHGEPNLKQIVSGDWTAGCIAVTNREMEWIYAMVEDGTPISIYP
jgi:murein L,D-transpeptidase YafK